MAARLSDYKSLKVVLKRAKKTPKNGQHCTKPTIGFVETGGSASTTVNLPPREADPTTTSQHALHCYKQPEYDPCRYHDDFQDPESDNH